MFELPATVRLIRCTSPTRMACARIPWRVDLTDRTDTLLAQSPHVVASADSAVIDGSRRWFNLARAVVESTVPDAWILDLGDPG